MARDCGFVKRKSTLSGSDFLELLMFNSQNGCQTTLNDLAEDFEINVGKSISKQGLDARFNENAVVFLNQVLSKMLSFSLQELKLQTPKNTFQSCMIKDSTRFAVPDQYAETYKGHGGATKSKAMISIQYEMDLFSGQYADLALTSACRNDQRDSKESCSAIRANTLLIRDLGYVTSTYLKSVIKKEAYFLNRLPSQMIVYDTNKNNEKVDFEKLERKMKRYQLPYLELRVLIGQKAQIPCRLIVHRADEKTARHRLKKTSKNSKSIGCKVSKEQKVRSRLSLYITNVKKEVLNTQNVADIYRLRWQIELVFKTWKSLCHIDKTKKVKIHRFECTLLAGLIWIFTNWKVFQCINEWFKEKVKNKLASIWKYFKHASKHSQGLRKILFCNEKLDGWLSKLIEMSETKFYRESKKGQPAYIELLKLTLNA